MIKTLSVALVVTLAALVSTTPGTTQDNGSSLNDPTIVAIFDDANAADIGSGSLAAQKGSSQAVRQFGAMLARDHKAVRQQGRDLAKKLGVTPTPPADKSGAKVRAEAMTSLRSKQGEDFDRAFLDHEIKFHEDVINAINGTLLPAIKNGELRQLVVKVAPAFQAHRDMAVNLRKKLGA